MSPWASNFSGRTEPTGKAWKKARAPRLKFGQTTLKPEIRTMNKAKRILRGRGGQQGGAGGFPEDLARAARDLATSVSFMPAGSTGIGSQGDVSGGHGFRGKIQRQVARVPGPG